ncbi:MAG: hypothetical protein HY053_00695 [Proteobacteria bacterium]|nr:hypothetical protein [Pseudomonadota bacterium]
MNNAFHTLVNGHRATLAPAFGIDAVTGGARGGAIGIDCNVGGRISRQELRRANAGRAGNGAVGSNVDIAAKGLNIYGGGAAADAGVAAGGDGDVARAAVIDVKAFGVR